MIQQLPFTALMAILAGVIAFFVIVGKCSLPKSFFENQQKREEMFRQRISREIANENKPPAEEGGEEAQEKTTPKSA